MNLKFFILALFVGFFTEICAQPAFMLFNKDLTQVNDIEQVGSQLLWLATDSGAVKVNLTTQNFSFYLPQPASGSQAFVRIKSAGATIWAASAFDGLWKFDGTTWTNYSKQNGLASDTIYDFDISANGHIWIATNRGISQFNGATFTTHNPFLYKVISAICAFGDSIYAGNATWNEPVKKYTNGIWQNIPSLSGVGNRTTSLKMSADGILHCTALNGTFSLLSTGWQQVFNGIFDELSKNGDFAKLYSYQNVGAYFSNAWDTLVNPMQFEFSGGNFTAISSFADSSFWCGINNGNQYALAHYFVPETENSYAELSANSLTAGFSSDGFFFKNSSKTDFTTLKGLGKTFVFMASPNISGWQGSAQNRISTSRTYANDGFPSLVIGPISTNRNSAAFFKKYNHVWRLTKAQIDAHKSNFANSGYIAPTDILTWPGNGNLAFGEEKYVAPFVDQNYNGIYEPMMGDYPDIRGDEAVYFVYNSAQAFSPFGHPKLNIEFHTMAYVFDSVGTPAHNAVFVNQKLIFKNQAFDTLLYGLFTDFDLGNAVDDVNGSDSIRAMYYVYNGDNDDEGPFGWGNKPPAAGLLSLQAPIVGFIDYNYVAGTNLTPEENQFMVLQRKWQDGTPMRVDNPSGFWSALNGSGYLPNSTAPKTNWQFNDAQNWYSPWLGLGDKRCTGVFEFTNIAVGDEVCFDYAFLYAGDSSYVDPSSSINELKYSATWLQTFYGLQSFTCANNSIDVAEENRNDFFFQVFPNPNNGQFYVQFQSTENTEAHFMLMNTLGQVVQNQMLLPNQTSEINLGKVSSGVYFCILKQGDRILKHEKIVVRK